MIKENNELEELIFDYLEGNLSREERNAFTLQISRDPNLQEQVDAWKMAFVEEVLPDTGVLENTLFKYPKKNNWVFSFNSCFFLGFLLFLIPVSLEENIKAFAIQPERIFKAEKTIVPEEKSELKIKGNESLQLSVKTTHTPETVKLNALEKNIKKEEPALYDLPEIKSISDNNQILSFSIDNETDKLIINSLRKKPKIHLLTKMELRDFNRKKKKSQEKKAAMEFLKGRIPYVVPLNSKNF